MSGYRRYPAYKPSGIDWLGDVPEHWTRSRLRFIATINPSKQEAFRLGKEAEVSFLPMEAIGDDGSLDLRQTRRIVDVESGYTYFAEGDLTIAKITPCFENGKGAIMRGLVQGIGFGTTELIVIRPGPGLDLKYAYYLSMSWTFRKLGEAEMYGAGGQKRVPDGFLRNFDFAWPPLEEQTEIAAFLDRETARIDSLITKYERLIELLGEKQQALISHAVTKGLDPDAPMKDSGVEWLGEVPAHWKVRKLGHLSVKIGSGKTPRGGAEVYVQEGVLFLRSQNVYDEGLRLDDIVYIDETTDREMSQTRVRGGDILLNLTGASLGRTCLVPAEFPASNVNQHVCIIRLSAMNLRQFISLFLKSANVKGQIDTIQNGAAREGLNYEQVASIKVAIPPLYEARRIFDHVDREAAKLDSLTAKTRQAIELLREHRTSLISAAVTGKIDVRQEARVEAAV